jgi:hypothetical protein
MRRRGSSPPLLRFFIDNLLAKHLASPRRCRRIIMQTFWGTLLVASGLPNSLLAAFIHSGS